MTIEKLWLIVTVVICEFIHQSQQNIFICGEPRLSNGGYRVEGSFVVLSCDNGYQLIGPKQIKCIRRSWNPPPATARCEKKSEDIKDNNEIQEQFCTEPPFIKNGRIEPQKEDGFYKVGDEISVRCDSYFKAVQGDTTLQCVDGPRWSGTFPLCVVTCRPLQSITAGEWKLSENKDTGELEAVFVCNHGLQLVRGFRGKTCIQGNKGYQWIGDDPQCNELEIHIEGDDNDKTCPLPPLIPNGQVYPNKMGQNYYVGEEVNVECNPTFHPVGGSTSLHCTDQGNWSDEFPDCKGLSCLIASQPENGVILELTRANQIFNYGDVITYKCEQGYSLEGQQRRICGDDGWSSTDPKCKLVACGDIPVLEYSMPKDIPPGKKFVPGEELEVECLFGFRKVNQQKPLHLFCDEKGQWDLTYAQCESISCERPPAIPNAVYEKLTDDTDSFYYGDKIHYTCQNDLVLVGKAALTCSANGWSDDFPSCEAIYCDNPDLSDGIKIQRTSLPLNSKNVYPFKTEIFYQCESVNYELVGSFSQSCTENGWSGRSPFCKLSGCLEPTVPENGRVYRRYKIRQYSKFYSVGDYIIFQCKWRYNIERESHQSETEASTSHCTADGTWTTIPRCTGTAVTNWISRNIYKKEVTCELPDHPENGQYLNILPEGARYSVDHTITFKCHPGYMLADSSFTRRKCYTNGKWTGLQPICKDVTCTKPPDIPNAIAQTKIYEQPRTRFGSSKLLKITTGFRLLFVCRDDHHMVPNGVEPPFISCLETGQWSEPNFECQSLQCGPLPIISDGYLSVYYQREWYPVGSRAGVICNEGFTAKKEELTCQPDGRWDVEIELCQGIYKAPGCGPVPPIERGRIETYPNNGLYYVGTVAAVYCNAGYKQNIFHVTCLEDGYWNVTGNECQIKKVVCGRVPKIPNGEIQPPSGMKEFTIGTRASVFCDSEFHSKRYVVTCENNGHWDLTDVACNRNMKHCNAPPRISNHGSIIDDNPRLEFYPLGHSITYVCEPNYELVPEGFQNNACINKGWLHDAPECVAEKCDPIPELKDGYFKPPRSGKIIPNLDKVKIMCNAGFIPSKEFLQCDHNGQWNTNDIVCQRDKSTDCDAPQPIENGIIENISNRKDVTYPLEYNIIYKCRDNYVLDGDDIRFCSDGGWSGESPVCKLNICKISKKVYNTKKDIRLPFGKTYRRICPLGQAVINGSDVVECLEGGRWNSSLPQCKPYRGMECPIAEFSNERGRFVPINQNTVELICAENFTPLNPNLTKSTCDERFGKWIIPQDMACVPVKPSNGCTEQDSIEHGTVSGLKEIPLYKEGDELILRCDRGYSFTHGIDSITCLASGYWDGVLDSCIPIECEINQNITNGDFDPPLQGEVFPYGKVLNVKCKRGYQISEKSLLHCSENGWDSQIPSCRKVKCSDPGIPDNGWYHATSFDYGERVAFGCFSGYKLYGSKERVCLENGKWSGPLTVCDSGNQDCPDPGKPVNGIKSGVNYNNGDVVKYSCLNGYTLMGSRSRTCKNHSWTGQEPECIGMLDYDDPNDVSQRFRILLKQMKHFETTGEKFVEIPKPIDKNRRKADDPNQRNSPAALIRKSMLVVCFIFDSSSSIGEDNFQKSIKLAQTLTQNLNISSNGTRSCVLVFNSEAKVEFTPSKFQSTAQVIDALKSIQYEGARGTSLLSAFKTFQEGILNPTVENFPDTQISFLTFIFTDGKVKPDYKLQKLVRNLRNEFNLKVYCVALTGFPNKDVLFSITSSYRNVKRIFFLDSYSTMDRITTDLMAGDEIDYSVCGRGFDSSRTVDDLSNRNTSDSDHSTLQFWPWTVQLLSVENGKTYIPTCLGSLLNKNWVLTSGLCFRNDVDPRRILTKTGVEKYHLSVAERIVHIGSLSNNNMWSANAALIKLKKPVTFSEYIHPVCLPAERLRLSQPNGQRKSGYSISWAKGIEDGRHGNIAQMQMTIQTRSDCTKSLSEEFVGGKPLDPTMFCASDNTGSLDVCGPDLGSPLYQYDVNSKNQAQWVQIGVASAFEYELEGEMSCINPSRFYDLFLDVSVILPTIKNIINN